MTVKPVIPRELANRDIEEALDYYRDQAGEGVALRFIDALEQAYQHIARHPGSGSSRYGYELNLQGLRFWRLKRYPHLVFYMEHETHTDVWRVLHGERDIPAWIRDPDVL